MSIGPPRCAIREQIRRAGEELNGFDSGAGGVRNLLDNREAELLGAIEDKMAEKQGARQRVSRLTAKYRHKRHKLDEKLNKLLGLAERAPIIKLEPKIGLTHGAFGPLPSCEDLCFPKYSLNGELGINYGKVNSELNTQSASLGYIGSSVRATLTYEASTSMGESGAEGSESIKAKGQIVAGGLHVRHAEAVTANRPEAWSRSFRVRGRIRFRKLAGVSERETRPPISPRRPPACFVRLYPNA